ncbi:MAG: hypothetical protein IKQ46_03260 [Bacteroidales bacterium]|nr:hypothetical protein [Bacteroidales bacterium]
MKKIFKPIAVLAFLLAASTASFAQEGSDMFDILTDYINEEQSTALTKLQEDIAKGEKLVSQAETQDKANAKFLSSTKKGKAKKGEKKSVEAKSLRIKAAKYYEKSFESLYDIYRSVVSDATFTYPADKTSAEQYLAEAETSLQDGSAKLKPYGKLTNKSLETTTYKTLKTDLATCKSKFEEAGKNCYRALKLYADQAAKKNKEDAADQAFWNSTVQTNTIDAYNRYISKYPNGKYVSEAKRRIANLQNMSKVKRVTSDNPDEGLAYRIQICADKKPWSQKKLARLYKGDLKIDERQTDGYYKYWIGCFRSYEDAQNAEQSMGLKQSFIVCFNEGVQIHITEAQELEANLSDE